MVSWKLGNRGRIALLLELDISGWSCCSRNESRTWSETRLWPKAPKGWTQWERGEESKNPNPSPSHTINQWTDQNFPLQGSLLKCKRWIRTCWYNFHKFWWEFHKRRRLVAEAHAGKRDGGKVDTVTAENRLAPWKSENCCGNHGPCAE